MDTQPLPACDEFNKMRYDEGRVTQRLAGEGVVGVLGGWDAAAAGERQGWQRKQRQQQQGGRAVQAAVIGR